jgi:gliding motility-associated-like protein
LRSPQADTLCFDEGTTFDISTVTPSINTTGTWVYDLVVTPSDPGVTGFTPTENDRTSLNFTDLLVNNTNTVQTVTYQFIPKILDPRTGLAYCEDGIDTTITIWINPQPRIEVSASDTLCFDEGTTFDISTVTPSINTTGTWVYDLVVTPSDPGVTGFTPTENDRTTLNFTDLLVNNTNTVQTVTYQFIPKILDPRTGLAYCEDGIDTTITIWINPQPRIEVSASDTLCFDEGTTFDISTVTPSINTTGTWVYDLVVTPSDPGVTGFTPTENDRTSLNFTDLLVNTTNTVQTVTYQFIPKILDPRTGLAYCEDGIDTTITIWINPQPRIAVSASDTLCFDEGTTFDVSTVTPSINTTGTWVYDLVVTPSDPGVTGFTPTENDRTTLNFTDLLVNNTNTVQTVTYQFIPKILDPRTGLAYCEDGIDTTITIWINPQPRIEVSASDTLCFDEGTTFDISTVTPSINTTGTWVYDLVVTPSDLGVTGFTPTENDRTTLNFTDLLVNATNTVQTVTYQFIPKILDPRTGLAYCEDGIDTTITIWINPQPRIEVSASDTLCFDEGTTFDISTVTPSINTTGTWVYDLVVTPSDPGVTGFTPTENDRTTLNFTDLLVNNTNTVQTVTYQFIPKILDPRTGLAYCEDGIDTTITIWINPQPRIEVSASDTLCFDEGTTFDVSTTNTTTGTWVYDLVVTPSDPGVTGFTPTENDRTTLNFTDLLVNTTNTVQTVTYQFIPKILDPRTGLAYCEDGIDTTITIWINPQPRIEVSASDTLCFDEGTTFDISTVTPSINTTGTWVYDLVVTPSDPGVTGFTPTENDRTSLNFTDLLVNNTNTVQTVTYQFIPKILDPRTGLAYCEDGIDTTITIWINPQPRIAVSASDTLCFDEGTTFDISTVTPSINTTGTWVYDLVVTPSDPGVTGFTPTENDRTSLNFTDLLVNNTNTVQTVTYQFIPKILDPRTGLAYCEDGIDTTITIWINPQPRILTEVSPDTLYCHNPEVRFDIDNPNTSVIGTWVYDVVSVASDPSVTGNRQETDITTITFTDELLNESLDLQWVDYTFIPKIKNPGSGALYCENGADTTIRIWLNPEPQLTVIVGNTTICDSTTVDIEVISSNGTVMGEKVYELITTDSDGHVLGVRPSDEFAYTEVSDYLRNISDSVQIVTYSFRARIKDTRTGNNFGYCEGSEQTVIPITLNPTPRFAYEFLLDTICMEGYAEVLLFSPSEMTTGDIRFNFNTTVTDPIGLTGWNPGQSNRLNNFLIADSLKNETNSTQFVTYYVTPTSPGTGCKNGPTVPVVIQVNPDPIDSIFVSKELECLNSFTGSIDLVTGQGSGPFEILWSGPNNFTSNQQNIESVTSGFYTVSVYDANKCFSNGSIILRNAEIIDLAVEKVSVSCFGGNDGNIEVFASLGGGEPYTYEWYGPPGHVFIDNTNRVQENLIAGDYYLFITDGKDCFYDTRENPDWDLTVYQPDSLIATIEGFDASCSLNSDGSAILTMTGGNPGFTYLWTGPDGFVFDDPTAKDQENLIKGDYSVSVLDSKNCPASASVTIGELYVLTITSNIITDFNGWDVSCYGAADGSAVLEHNSLRPPFIFTWTGPNGYTADGDSAVNMSAGTYYYYIQDDAGCTGEGEVELIEPEPVEITDIFTLDPSCFGYQNGEISISPEGGTGNFFFDWATGQSSSMVRNLGAGSYPVRISDENNCYIDTLISISQPEPLTISPFIQSPYCELTEEGLIILNTQGGTAPYYWSWSTGETSEDITNITAGMYVVDVLDDHGCMLTRTFFVEALNPLCVDIPNTFTPNGDGRNDFWIIGSVEGGSLGQGYPYAVVEVFNRWGELVYRSQEGYPQPWDGTSEGRLLPVDSYYYVITLNNGKPPVAGVITILY